MTAAEIIKLRNEFVLPITLKEAKEIAKSPLQAQIIAEYMAEALRRKQKLINNLLKKHNQ